MQKSYIVLGMYNTDVHIGHTFRIPGWFVGQQNQDSVQDDQCAKISHRIFFCG